MKNINKLFIFSLCLSYFSCTHTWFNFWQAKQPAAKVEAKTEVKADVIKTQTQALVETKEQWIHPHEVDQQKQMQIQQTFVDLQQPARNSINLKGQKKELVDLVAAAIDLDVEIQKNKNQDGQSLVSLALITAYHLNKVKAGYTATSKHLSYGLSTRKEFVFLKRLDMWRHGIVNTANEFKIDVKPSEQHPGYIKIVINADGAFDEKESIKPAHSNLAALIRKIDKEQQSQTPNNQNSAIGASSSKESLIMGEIKGKPCPLYGCNKKIILHCKPELIGYLIKENARKQAEKEDLEEAAALAD